MDKFLFIDKDKNLYDINFNKLNNDENIVSLINKNGFKRENMTSDRRAIGMRIVGAKAIYEDAIVFIKMGNESPTNMHFKEPMKSLFSSDNKRWVKFYDFDTYNHEVDATITNMDGSIMSDLEKKNYALIKSSLEEVKYNQTVNNLGFKFICTKLSEGQCLNAVYENIKPVGHEIQIRPDINIEPDNIKITIDKNIETLRVNVTNSSYKIKDSLKEF